MQLVTLGVASSWQTPLQLHVHGQACLFRLKTLLPVKTGYPGCMPHARVVVGVSLALALTGCSSSGAEPRTLPTLASGSPSLLPVKSTASPAVASHTPEGAVAFARYWYGQVELAYGRRDPSLVVRLSAPGCVTCDRYVKSITRARANDERVEGLSFRITFAEAPALSGNSARVDVIYDAPATHRYDSAGHEIHSQPSVKGFKEQLELILVNGSWLVAQDAAV